ncbi:MarR family winged helix-turn-helix transcriptional regulator [Streptomyces sp. NPDC013953]|uniref:MarR family winged helix-turn-helix transcriptional regulator n=1 Tax=Streptomyces sp. NPDC013953 TaxID=3364868 RepID=UPI0036F7141E
MSDSESRTTRGPAEAEAHADARTAAAALVALWEYADLHAPGTVPHLTMRALSAVHRSTTLGPAELGKALDITPASASRLCGRLERAGWLTRRSHADDRRRTVLEITARGAEEMERMRARCVNAMAAALPRSAARLRAVETACDIARTLLRRAVCLDWED